MRVSEGPAYRILDFDIENRPLSYWIPDRPTSEITSIAWCFLDSPFEPQCMLLGRDDPKHILETFVDLYNQADMVTGHYVLRHDLPIIQAHLVEYGLPSLGPKLVQDTKVHLSNWKDLPKTQEHLSDMMGVRAPKIHMTQAMWREANRLTPKGLTLTENRVVGDVIQHMELRNALLNRSLLRGPTLWRP